MPDLDTVLGILGGGNGAPPGAAPVVAPDAAPTPAVPSPAPAPTPSPTDILRLNRARPDTPQIGPDEAAQMAGDLAANARRRGIPVLSSPDVPDTAGGAIDAPKGSGGGPAPSPAPAAAPASLPGMPGLPADPLARKIAMGEMAAQGKMPTPQTVAPPLAPAPSGPSPSPSQFLDPYSGMPAATWGGPGGAAPVTDYPSLSDLGQFASTAAVKGAGGLMDFFTHMPGGSAMDAMAIASYPKEQQAAIRAKLQDTSVSEPLQQAYFSNVVPEFKPQTPEGRVALAGASGLVGGGPFGVIPAGASALSSVLGQGAAEMGAGPKTQLAASLLPALVPGGAAGIRGVARAATALPRRFLAPTSLGRSAGLTDLPEGMNPTTGQANLAGQRIAGAATDLPAVRSALAANTPEIVPGSAPTTHQLTGDQGLGALERVSAGRSSPKFIARRAAQNKAQTEALGARSRLVRALKFQASISAGNSQRLMRRITPRLALSSNARRRRCKPSRIPPIARRSGRLSAKSCKRRATLPRQRKAACGRVSILTEI
jgi:hypothetical protein